MRRIKAVLLLLTLTVSPVSALAGFLAPGPDCCLGNMCPMHQNSQGNNGCDGNSQPTCHVQCCAPHSVAGTPQATSEAILIPEAASIVPRAERLAIAFVSVTAASRITSPPEQPPRR